MSKAPLDHQELMNQMVHEIKDFAFFLLDKDGRIISWNDGAKHITGYSREEVIGIKASALVGDFTANKESVEASLTEALDNEVAHHVGWRVHKTNGLFWADIKVTPLKSNEGELLGFSVITKDITYTREKELENDELLEKVHKKNKELEEFNYMVSHDLQEPLRTIRSFIGILDTKYADHVDEKVSTITKTITKASERMNDMLLALLEHSRIGRTAEITEVSLYELCENVKLDLSSLISKTKAEITYNTTILTVLADKIGIQVLFQNLISNAIKFVQPNSAPKIEISVLEKDTHYEFQVKDNGIGIPQSQLERIFVIFQRLHVREEYEGTGIGLAHCKKIVEMHNGKIWVESEENVGSTFYFTLSKSVT